MTREMPGYIILHFYLNVDEQLRWIEFCDDGNPGDTDGNQQDDERPTHNEELCLWGFTSEPGPDIHGEDSRGAVEYWSEWRHQSCHHHCQHETLQAGWHQLQHQFDVGDVGTAGLWATDLHALHWVGAGNLQLHSQSSLSHFLLTMYSRYEINMETLRHLCNKDM